MEHYFRYKSCLSGKDNLVIYSYNENLPTITVYIFGPSGHVGTHVGDRIQDSRFDTASIKKEWEF